MSREEQFDFYWKEIFTGLAYNPIEFNTYRFDQSMSLPRKVNKLYDMFKVLALNNQEVMDYLKEFSETFDEKLYGSMKDVLDQWLLDGKITDIVANILVEMNAFEERLANELDSAISSMNGNLDSAISSMNDNLDFLSNKLILNINDYPRLDSELNDDGRFMRALADLGNGTLMLNNEKYSTVEPITLRNYQSLSGVYGGTIIEKGSGSNDKSVIKVIESSSQFFVNINNLIINYYGNERGIIGIDMSLSSQLSLENIFIKGYFQKGIVAKELWLANIKNVTAWCDNEYGEIAFDIKDGTSLNLSTVWSKNFARGFNLGATLYSVLNACACDTFTVFAYNGGQTVTYIACAAEDGDLDRNGFIFGNKYRNMNLVGCQIMNIDVKNPLDKNTISIIYSLGAKVSVEGFRSQTDFNRDGLIDWVHALSDSKVTINNSTLPSNFNRKILMDSEWGQVTIKSSFTTEVFTSNGEDITLNLKNQYLKGFKKLSDVKIVGDSLNQERTFTATSNIYSNYYRLATYGSEDVKTILTSSVNNSGIYLVLVDMTIIVSEYSGTLANVNPTKLSVVACDSSSHKKIESVTVVSGKETHGVKVEWVGNNLNVSLEKPYATCMIDVNVSQLESNGLANLKWGE